MERTMVPFLLSLSAGDVITVTFAGDSRTVAVQSVEGGYVFTTSGTVRPGRIGGGVLRIRGNEVTYQPTLGQAPKDVIKVERAVLPFRRAA